MPEATSARIPEFLLEVQTLIASRVHGSTPRQVGSARTILLKHCRINGVNTKCEDEQCSQAQPHDADIGWQHWVSQ